MSYSVSKTRQLCEKVAKLSPCYNEVPSEDYYKGLVGYYAFIAHARTALPEANELLAECRGYIERCRDNAKSNVDFAKPNSAGYEHFVYELKKLQNLLERIGE